MNTQLMDQVAATSSRTEKERLLRKADSATKRGLMYALDPYRTYGITLDWADVDAVIGTAHRRRTDSWWSFFYGRLDDLAARDLTGSDARLALLRLFSECHNEDAADWAWRILHKDLRCGVSIKTVTKVFPGLVQPFEVALAKAWKGKPLPEVGYLEPKLDGLRVTVVDGIARTRNGNEVSATDAMLDELASMANLNRWVFDGEFIGSGTFEETISRARKSGQENRGLVYHVFDVVARDEWMARSTRPFSARRRDVEKLIRSGQYVTSTESIRIEHASPGDLRKACDDWIRQGYEGAMFKADVPYQFKRSSALLKIKKWDTIDGKIVGFEEGKGKYQGILGALVVQLKGGIKVNVGGGFSDTQREAIWDNRQKLLGKTAEIQFQNKTSKDSLRFPIFLRFRDDK